MTIKNGYTQFIFSNLEEFITDCESCPEELRKSSINNGKSWSGADSLEEAVDIARHGVDLDKISGQLKSMKETEHFELQAVESVSGAVVNMSNYLEGIPENMIDFPLIEANKFIELLADVGENAHTSAQQMINKATACAYLVDHFENLGYRVKFNVGFFNSGGWSKRPKEAVIVNVKEFKEPISIGQIAGCMHPSFFRVLGFMHMEKHFSPVPSGYGSMMGKINEIKIATENMFRDDFVFLPNIPTSGCDFRNMTDSIAWAQKFINETLNKQINA